MKFVHDITWKHGEDVSGRVFVTVAPYCGRVMDPPQFSGGRAEVTFFPGSDESNDEVTIEGPLKDVKAALKEALSMIEDMEEHYTEQYKDHQEHAVKCVVCGAWYDDRDGEPHADGRGNLCLRDGTVLMGDRNILLRVEGEWVDGDSSALYEGASFKIKEPIGEYEENRIFVALEKPKKVFQRGHPPTSWLMIRVDRDPKAE